MFVAIILKNAGVDCCPGEEVEYFQEVAGIGTTYEEAEKIGAETVTELYENNASTPELNFEYDVQKVKIKPKLFVANVFYNQNPNGETTNDDYHFCTAGIATTEEKATSLGYEAIVNEMHDMWLQDHEADELYTPETLAAYIEDDCETKFTVVVKEFEVEGL